MIFSYLFEQGVNEKECTNHIKNPSSFQTWVIEYTHRGEEDQRLAFFFGGSGTGGGSQSRQNQVPSGSIVRPWSDVDNEHGREEKEEREVEG
jgi:hypothetical protein